MTHFSAFIDLPMPELPIRPTAPNYVCIYDIIESEHSLFTCDPDDLVSPAATMARFEQRAAGQIGVDRRSVAALAVATAHTAFVTNEDQRALSDRLGADCYILTEVEQHPWLLVIRAPQGVRVHRAPKSVTNAVKFKKWVYSKGRQMILGTANELVAMNPQGFQDFVDRNGISLNPLIP